MNSDLVLSCLEATAMHRAAIGKILRDRQVVLLPTVRETLGDVAEGLAITRDKLETLHRQSERTMVCVNCGDPNQVELGK